MKERKPGPDPEPGKGENRGLTPFDPAELLAGLPGLPGVYRFKTHNGDIAVGVPRSAGATVAVSTFSGDFESNFPVTLSGSHNARRFQFAVGDGSAHVELSSFQGTIQLYRAVETASARVSKMDNIVERIIDKRLDKKIEKANKVVKIRERYQKRHDGDDGSYVGGE